MRKLKPLFTVLSIILFILGVGLTVCLFQSTTNELALEDSSELRFDLGVYSNSYLSNQDEITLFNHNTYGSDHYVEETLSCEKSEEVNLAYKCEMVSRLYKNEDNSLVRTSYFPGDNFKYTDDGVSLLKTDFSNEDLSNYFVSLLSGASSVNSFIYFDHIYPETKSEYSFETSLSFKFKTFSIHKTTTMFHLANDTKTEIAEFTYDGKDRLIKLEYNNSLVLEFSYDDKDLKIPSLKDYQYSEGAL